MRSFRTLGVLIAALGLVSMPSIAQAQALSIRTEVGVAAPLSSPQASRFDAGVSADIKPELGIGHFFSFGPSLSFLALSSNLAGVDTGTAFGLGGFLRLKRPHDEQNTGSGFGALSPWIDGDAAYIRTGPLDRFGVSVGVGASVPTSDARNVWVGPFVRYQDVVETTKPGFDTRDARILIAGLSLEFGGSVHRKAKEVPPPTVVIVVREEVPPPVVVVTPPPVVVVSQEVTVEYKEVIQFAWDSPVLDSTATSHLEEVLKKLLSSHAYSSIRVEGYASSEGQSEHNKVLSQHRADAVVAFLVARGIPQDKLSAVGLGIADPVADNSTEAGRRLNRRDEFRVKFVVIQEGSK